MLVFDVILFVVITLNALSLWLVFNSLIIAGFDGLIRWAFIGSSLVEVSGSIGSVYSLLIPYAFLVILYY